MAERVPFMAGVGACFRYPNDSTTGIRCPAFTDMLQCNGCDCGDVPAAVCGTALNLMPMRLSAACVEHPPICGSASSAAMWCV
eukprot:scaffold32712_cov20-Tisochrysis_lutea.AAC.2